MQSPSTNTTERDLAAGQDAPDRTIPTVRVYVRPGSPPPRVECDGRASIEIVLTSEINDGTLDPTAHGKDASTSEKFAVETLRTTHNPTWEETIQDWSDAADGAG